MINKFCINIAVDNVQYKVAPLCLPKTMINDKKKR